MPRLLFVNRFYSPDHAATGQLLTDLARSEAAQGAEVVVITSRPPGAPPQEDDHGVTVVRVRSTRTAVSVLGKAVDFGTFYAAALWQIARRVRRDDTLVVLTDPPLLGIAATWVGRMRGARIIHWLHDIYPEVASAVTGRTSLGLLKPLRNAAWRRSVRCVALSHEMAGVVAAAGVPAHAVQVIANWPPAGLAAVPPDDPRVRARRREWGLAGKFIVGYSGNLGRVHDLQPVIAAAAALRQHEAIAFVFVGAGAQQAALRAEASRRGLANVHFLPPQPRGTMDVSLAAADLHLVTLKPGCERFVYPSKLYGILAVGRPVLFVGPPACELARFVRQAGVGRVVDRDCTDDFVRAVNELAADPVAYRSCHDAVLRAAGDHTAGGRLADWHELLAAVRACPPRARVYTDVVP